MKYLKAYPSVMTVILTEQENIKSKVTRNADRLLREMNNIFKYSLIVLAVTKTNETISEKINR